MKNKVITLSLTILTATLLLIGCGSINNKEEATTVQEATETEETITVEEITDEENSTTEIETSTVEETTTEIETTTDAEYNGEEGYVSGNSLKEKEVTTTKKDTTPAKKDTTPSQTTPSTETPSTETPTPDTTPSTGTSPDGSNDGYQPDGTYISPVDGSVKHPGDSGVSSDGSTWYYGGDGSGFWDM
jgi:uncharacterized protein YceK